MSEAWSREEVEAAVADYFAMRGSVERKHQNISAVLMERLTIPQAVAMVLEPVPNVAVTLCWATAIYGLLNSVIRDRPGKTVWFVWRGHVICGARIPLAPFRHAVFLLDAAKLDIVDTSIDE